MKPIIPGLFTFTGLIMGRVYAVEDPDGLTIIDTSINGSAPRILRQLAQAGRQPSDVRRILITHAHPDHIGGLAPLRAATGAQVYASAPEREVIERRATIATPPRDSMPGLWKMMIPSQPASMAQAQVDEVVSDGDILREVFAPDGGLQVVSTPGHAPGHVSFWQPARRILITGDVIWHLRGLTMPLPPFTVDMRQNARSALRVIALQPETVCFGHGEPLMSGAATTLAAWSNRIKPLAGV